LNLYSKNRRKANKLNFNSNHNLLIKSNINNQTQDLFALDTVQDLDNETAATCSGGDGFLNGPDPDVILYKDPNLQGESLGVNAATGDGIPNIGNAFNDQTSSILIKRGVWRFYQDVSYNQGNPPANFVVLGPGNYNLGANNDNITSLERIAA